MGQSNQKEPGEFLVNIMYPAHLWETLEKGETRETREARETSGESGLGGDQGRQRGQGRQWSRCGKVV